MTRTKDTTVVSVLHPVCCGLDIHKQFVTACLMTIDSMGKETSLLESFGTFTDDLVRLREWLLEHECPIVALESTGVILETRAQPPRRLSCRGSGQCSPYQESTGAKN